MRGRILVFALVLAGCSKKAPEPFALPAMPVTTAPVEVRDVPLYFEEMGVVAASQTAEVRPMISGRIEAVHFKDGEWVEEGELLYTIDEETYAIRVEEIEAQLVQNRAHLENAKKKWERYKSLAKPELIAEVEWDELRTRIELAAAMVKGDLARLTAAKLDLNRCRIVAPISGRAGKSALGKGNIATSQAILVTLSEDRLLLVDFAVTEKERSFLPDSKMLIEIYAPGEEECLALGEVTFIDHSMNPDSGMLAAVGVLTEKRKPLFPGQAVRVHLHYGKMSQVQLVPLRAIKTNQWGSYLYSVNEDHTVEMRPVKLGPEERGMIVVIEGLAGAAKVVTEGQLRLFPGSKIEEVFE